MTPHINLGDGSRFYLYLDADRLAPEVAKITLPVALNAASSIPRFCGHTHAPLVLRDHLVHCATVARYLGLDRDVERLCFIHDLSELVISDIPKPVKDRFCSGALTHYETILLDAFCRHHIDKPLVDLADEWAQMHEIDRALCSAEAQRYMPNPEDYQSSAPKPLRQAIDAMFLTVPAFGPFRNWHYRAMFREIWKEILK